MIHIRRTAMGAVLAGASAVLSVAAAPLAAHATMTDPPACVESPFGGCQDGPLGNGIGGGSSPAPDVFSEYYLFASPAGPYDAWEFRRNNGRWPSVYDASRILHSSPQFQSCAIEGAGVVCY